MLTKEQANALLAFLAGFDALTGQWPKVERIMADEWGIEDPEAAIDDARQALERAS